LPGAFLGLRYTPDQTSALPAGAGNCSGAGSGTEVCMVVLSDQQRAAKLRRLCDIEGFEDEDALFAAAISDSVCPAICCNPDNPDCEQTAEMEPDQDRGWCEEWQTGTMVSVLVVGGIICCPASATSTRLAAARARSALGAGI